MIESFRLLGMIRKQCLLNTQHLMTFLNEAVKNRPKEYYIVREEDRKILYI